MKRLMKNRYLRIALGLFVTAMLFIMGHHEAGHGTMYATAAAVGAPATEDELTADETKVVKAVQKMIDQQLKDAKTGMITKDQLEQSIKEAREGLTKKELKSIEDILSAQGVLINQIKESGSKKDEAKSVKMQIKEYIDANKEKWEAFKRGESKSFGIETDAKGNVMAGIELKAITMTVGASTGGSAFVPQPEFVPGVVDLARNQPFIEAYSNASGTSSPRIVWTEKTNPLGNAQFIAEGTLKPLISFEIKTKESYAKKVTDKIKVSTEMLDDIDFIAGEIEKELRYQVDIKVDTELFNGAGDATSSADTLKGLNSYAGAFVLTTVKTSTPNNFDAIRAVIAQIVSLNFNATHVFLNPIDAANMDLVKDSQGRPIAMEYRAANGTLYRLTVVETNQQDVGRFLVGDMSKFVIRNYRPFSVQYGWSGDDFDRNLVTILGERRLHCYVADNNTGAFVDDTFSNVKAAIDSAV